MPHPGDPSDFWLGPVGRTADGRVLLQGEVATWDDANLRLQRSSRLAGDFYPAWLAAQVRAWLDQGTVIPFGTPPARAPEAAPTDDYALFQANLALQQSRARAEQAARDTAVAAAGGETAAAAQQAARAATLQAQLVADTERVRLALLAAAAGRLTDAEQDAQLRLWRAEQIRTQQEWSDLQVTGGGGGGVIGAVTPSVTPPALAASRSTAGGGPRPLVFPGDRPTPGVTPGLTPSLAPTVTQGLSFFWLLVVALFVWSASQGIKR